METMENLRERLEALENQARAFAHQTRAAERRLRWWRAFASGQAWRSKRRMHWSICLLVAALVVYALAPHPVQAKTFHCGAGNVRCLIAAINEANANGQKKNTILLEAGTYRLTSIDNTGPGFGNNNGLPVITGAMTINGESAETTIIERDSGAPAFRILDVAASGRLILNGLTIRGGFMIFAGGAAGISNAGTLTINQSIIEQNQSPNGGPAGIDSGGILTITSSIIRNNFGGVFGGGIRNRQPGEARIMNSTIARNNSQGGGGVTNFAVGGNATMTIQNSTISDNVDDIGGGVSNSGIMSIINTTIANNRAGLFEGGGIDNGGILTITNSTISGNTTITGAEGGGIFNSGTVILQNTILALNSSPLPRFGPDCFGPITSLGNNIIGDLNGCDINLLSSDLTGDPGLGAFVDDGMPGRGHFPLNPGSQAVDAGNNAACPRRDQLGRRRMGPCDIGAISFRDKDDRRHEEDDDRRHEEDTAKAFR